MAGDETIKVEGTPTEQPTNPKPPFELDVPTEFPKDLDVLIVNMDQVLFEGKSNSVIVPINGASLAILPGHTPLFTKIEKGTITLNKMEGKEEFDIDGGIAKITQAKIVILVGFAEEPEKSKKNQ